MRENLDEIRARAEKRVKQRRDALTDVIAFVAINAIVWGVWSFVSPTLVQTVPVLPAMGTLGLVLLTAIWGLVAVWQLIETYLRPWLDDTRERAVEREIQRELLRHSDDEKPKRGRLMLSDDGELEEIGDTDNVPSEKPKRDEHNRLSDF
jgi:hypothetical protein